jgi:chromosome segregation ATPase
MLRMKEVERMSAVNEGLRWYERFLAPRLENISGQISSLQNRTDDLIKRLDEQATTIRRETDLSRNELVAKIEKVETVTAANSENLNRRLDDLRSEIRTYNDNITAQMQYLLHLLTKSRDFGPSEPDLDLDR